MTDPLPPEEDQEVEVDLPKAPEDVPDWVRVANEKSRGVGINPKNARKLTLGGEKPNIDLSSEAQQALGGESEHSGVQAPSYEPSEDEILAVKDKVEPGLFQWIWDKYMEKKRTEQKRKADEWYDFQARNEGIKRELRDSGRIKQPPLPPEP